MMRLRNVVAVFLLAFACAVESTASAQDLVSSIVSRNNSLLSQIGSANSSYNDLDSRLTAIKANKSIVTDQKQKDALAAWQSDLESELAAADYDLDIAAGAYYFAAAYIATALKETGFTQKYASNSRSASNAVSGGLDYLWTAKPHITNGQRFASRAEAIIDSYK